MKYLLPVILVVSLYLTPIYPIYAETATKPGELKPIKLLDRKETMLQRVDEKMGNLQDRIASREAMLREKLAKFKDQNKAKRVQNVNDNLAKINQERTAQMSKHLDTMTEIVGRVQSVIDENAAKGKDVGTATAAINDAKSTITEAQEAVNFQKAKDYTIEATSEATIRLDAMKARNDLRTDLVAVHEKVMAARKVLIDAITVTKKTLQGGVAPSGQ